MRFFAPLILLFSFAQASEVDGKLLRQLVDDDFDLREAASKKLSRLPFDNIEQILKLSETSAEPEMRARLKKIAFEIYFEYAYTHDDNILRLRTELGIETSLWGIHLIHHIGEQSKGIDAFVEHIRCVDMDGPANNKLEAGDFIIEIDGKNAEKMGFKDAKIEAGKVCKIVVLRPKPGRKEKTEGTDIDENDLEPKTVEVTPVLAECRDNIMINRLIIIGYRNFLKERK